MFKIIYTISTLLSGSTIKVKETETKDLETALIELRNEELNLSNNGEIENIEILSISKDGDDII